ncbi:MAG: glycerophosphodiester phosphodiesterase [Chloroflexi bacterium]|nr:MAG: glycerophosphodiester phosphodiesterase [Chloroflexota bacterium]
MAARDTDDQRRTSRRRPYLTHTAPLFFAHRGGAALRPENTLLAFSHGLSFGADALELDIQMTRDGEIVIMHDPTVDRTTNGVGPVAGFSLEELRRLDAGYRFTTDGGETYPFRGTGCGVPTLREVLEMFPQVRLNIDLKQTTPPREQRLWHLIQEYEARDRVLVASGNLHEGIIRFRELSLGQVATSASAPEIRTFVLACLFHTTGLLHPAYDALQVPDIYRGIRVVSPRTIGVAHEFDLDMHVWTIDDASTMRLLLSWGVDGLMSDRPDILAQVLRDPGLSGGD